MRLPSISGLAVKPLLIAIAVLLVALSAAGVRMHVLGADRDAAVAQADAEKARAGAAEQSRDTWKQAAQDRGAASLAWKSVAQRRLQLLQQAQAENARLGEANRNALQQAQADAAKARREAAAWKARAQPVLATDRCKAALSALERDCPVGNY